jgi:branched-chain amino acid transport system ATP-binding protein
MALFEVRDVTVRYGGVAALRGASLTAEPHSIHGLIGPNGAGKSTLFNVATGLVTPNTGRVYLDGEDVTRLSTHARARRGLSRTFQQLELFGVLTVHDNLLVAAELHARRHGDGGEPRQAVTAMLERMHLSPFAEVRADHLPTGIARLVEVARALMTRPKVLLLDEPAAGLIDAETQALGNLLRELAAEGLCIILVEHDMELVMPVCSAVTVLDRGEILATGTPREISGNPDVVRAYLGTSAGAVQ